jgi:hypothetical protein
MWTEFPRPAGAFHSARLSASRGWVLMVARVWGEKPGRAFEPQGLPDLPGKRFIRPGRPLAARHGTTTWTLHPGTLRRNGACEFRQGKVLAGRKPALLFRFAGAFLLRLPQRTFIA